MHPCDQLLGEVEALMSNEEFALAEEDIEQMEIFCDQRKELLQKVWEAREGYDHAILRKRLLFLEARQNAHVLNATSLYERLGAILQTTQKQGQYYAGTKYQQMQNQKSRYITMTS